MMNENLVKILSDQVNAEYYSAYLYLSMSAKADQLGLKGFANWLFVQAQEEMAHGTNMYQYILDRGEMPIFGAIESPLSDFSSVLEMFEKVLSHEQEVTRRINAIATMAMKEQDHACYQFIMWYVNEQVEEESSASDLLSKIQMVGDNKGLLLTLDTELSTRTFVSPFPI
ncbi:MAG: ferritin [Defluviitaleaceae bacterium]|nr:ferritin [Defluviitaleaceae bacterium]